MHLRTYPLDHLTEDQVAVFLKERDFFDHIYNENGRGLRHQLECVERGDKSLVVDPTTGLTWQRGSAKQDLAIGDAQGYVDCLNSDRFGGYSDWRLPTLEEAMSLMRSTQNENGLYLDAIFGSTSATWTADRLRLAVLYSWVVYFSRGYCGYQGAYNFGFSSDVRAVRTSENKGSSTG